jgi:hypothetical protein
MKNIVNRFGFITVLILFVFALSGCVVNRDSMTFKLDQPLTNPVSGVPLGKIYVQYSDGTTATSDDQTGNSITIPTDINKKIVGGYVSDGHVSWVPEYNYSHYPVEVVNLLNIESSKPKKPAGYAVLQDVTNNTTYSGYVDVTFAVYDSMGLVDGRTAVFAHSSLGTEFYDNDPAGNSSDGAKEGFASFTQEGKVTFIIKSDVNGISTLPLALYSGTNQIYNSTMNISLNALSLSSGTLDPSFEPGKTSYSAHVPYSVSSLTVTASVYDSSTTTLVIDNNPVGQVSSTINLNEGSNVVTITVKALNSSVGKTYTVNITRAAADFTTPIQLTAEPVSITVPSGVLNARIAVTTTMEDSIKVATLPFVEVQAETSLGNVNVTIPAGTKVTAPASWDGTIKLPEVKSNSSVTISGGEVSAVIEVGSPDVSLTFDKAVRLLIPNQGGKSAGFVRNGVFTPITTPISEDSQQAADLIAAGGDAAITVGNDLVIWTKHFTLFASYTPPEQSDGGSGGGAPANSGTISAANGGTLTLNGATIVVSPGAAVSNIQVTVDKVRDLSKLPVDPIGKLVSDVYEIKKDKDGDFNKPVVITLPFDKTKVDFEKSVVGLYWLDEKTDIWMRLDDQKVDQDKATVSGAVTHFTKFAVQASDKEEIIEIDEALTNVVEFDDIAEHWAAASIQELVQLEVINGYPDNTFKPDNSMTRSEFVTIIVKAFNLESQEGVGFADTSNHWAESEIGIAAALGIVTGYTEGTFGPDDLITREQMAAIIIRAANITAEDAGIEFTDSSEVSDWAHTVLAAAVAEGLIDGYEDGTIKPQANTTRAEAVTVILRALQLNNLNP